MNDQDKDTTTAAEQPEREAPNTGGQAEPGPAPEKGERAFDIPLGLLLSMLGGAGGSLFRPGAGGIHEIGVQGSVLEQARSQVEDYMRPDIITLTEPASGTKVLAMVGKDGVEAIDSSQFDDYRTAPLSRTGTAALLTLDSFIDHVNRFSDSNTAIFADNDRSKPSLTAVLDYHGVGATAKPRFGKHRSSFAFPLSDEWKAWNAANGKVMPMAEFASFLEDRIIDVMPLGLMNLSPEAKLFVDTLGGTGRIAEPARLMELATGLQIYENSVVSEVNKLASGEGELKFETTHLDAAGNKLNIPSMFVIGIPVFKGGEPYQVIARLRYRKSGAQIVFFYELWRTDRVFDHAFDEAVTRVRNDTGRPVFLGRDESKLSA